ncbi:MAG: S8 family serine peptidase, partial [Chloroflexaceae bacterium]|nr:S8 family serine peptidase [Chloroflexaceae bacterium]
MSGRFFQRTAGLLVVLALLLGIFGNSLSSVTATPAARSSLPGYFDAVAVATEQWAQEPPGQQAEAIAAVVHLDMAPMAVVGKGWSHQQRIAYMRQLQAAQDALIPQIIALGGTVEGRLTQATVGLAVSIDSRQVGQLGRLGTVAAVRRVNNYRLAATPALAAPPVSRAIERLPVDGRGVQIAVIDTGVDYTHKKLGGPGTSAAFAAAYCGDGTIPPERVTPTCGTAHELPTAPKRSGRFGDIAYGRDPANPAPKVVGGWDWVGEVWPNPDPRCPDANGRPTPCLAQDANPIDYYGHGTQIADIIAGLETAPGANDAGVAPGAGIWAFKACSAITGECSGTALLLAIDDALDLDDSDYGACTPGGSRPQDRFCLAYDPADVINLSLGSNYGQPEDDLTLFVNMASYYGSLVVAAAGNDGDRPYIVSSPSTAEAALSVGQTAGVAATIFTVRSADLALPAMHQPWSQPITADLRASVQYGDGAGSNLTGCSPFAAPQLGRALLLDRGGCETSLKAANASAAGAALALIADTQQANTPLLTSYDGGSITLPALTLTKADGDRLKALLRDRPTSEVRVAASERTTRPNDMAASSSRGPRIADNDIKPDLSAPGSFFAATARSGAETSFISGTSASAPVVAGTAALMIQELKRVGLVGQSSGLAVPCSVATGCPEGLGGRISLVPLLKSVLMNSADPNLTVGGELLAPITLQGSGEVDPRATFRQRTVAWDVTDLNNYLRREIRDPACAVNPVVDVLNFIFNPSIPPRCALNFPFGNEFFRTWNAQTGSLSFGFDTVAGSRTVTRKLVVANTSAAERTYRLSSNFRYESDRNRGVTVTISPTTV